MVNLWLYTNKKLLLLGYYRSRKDAEASVFKCSVKGLGRQYLFVLMQGMPLNNAPYFPYGKKMEMQGLEMHLLHLFFDIVT